MKELIHFIAQFLKDNKGNGEDSFMLIYLIQHRPDIVKLVFSDNIEENL